ncbi:carbohydrate-binding module family 14 protein [Nannocystis radixulma]|uniref:carbohydrate-binding module family 14 protein n=1 Tax=Nannocystis radixulma TaxID=2995305 RepID=UPI00358DD317
MRPALRPAAEASLTNTQVVYRPGADIAPANELVDWYDCSRNEDGNYVHFTDCREFISCVAKRHAYERSCALPPPGGSLWSDADGVIAQRTDVVRGQAPSTMSVWPGICMP